MDLETNDMHANKTYYLRIPYDLAKLFELKPKERTKFIIEYDSYYDENEFKVRRVTE